MGSASPFYSNLKNGEGQKLHRNTRFGGELVSFDLQFWIRRRPEELWQDFIRRASHTSEDLVYACGAKEWVTLQNDRKLELATQCMLHDSERWTNKLLHWKPHFRCWPQRNVGRPVARWLDSFRST